MLYISRQVGAKHYMVVDTDDNSEEMISYRELVRCCTNLGLQIRGVSVEGDRVVGISAYTESDISAKRRQKFKSLYGVDIKTRLNQIVDIEYNILPAAVPPIRLSDFGTSCAGAILRQNQPRSDIVVELVADDGVDVRESTFAQFPLFGVRLDLQAFSQDLLVEKVCADLLQFVYRYADLERYISDKPLRMDYYKASFLLEKKYSPATCADSIYHVMADPERINAIISDKHRNEFISLSKVEFSVRKPSRFTKNSHEFASWLADDRVEVLLRSRDFETIRSTRYLQMFDEMRGAIPTDLYISLFRFENYIRIFNATQELQDAFITLCVRWRNWFLKYAKRRKWGL